MHTTTEKHNMYFTNNFIKYNDTNMILVLCTYVISIVRTACTVVCCIAKNIITLEGYR
jgi:hypothetical protein